MGKCCLHASLIIFDQIIIKVAGNQDRHKSSVEFDFGPNQTTHFGVTCPWVTKMSHFWTWISLKPVGQSWSNFICSIIRVVERLLKVSGQIDFGTLDSGEHCCPLGYLFVFVFISSHRWGVYRACNALCMTSISYTSLMHFEAGFCPRHREVNWFLCINVRVICCTVCIYHSMYIPYKEF